MDHKREPTEKDMEQAGIAVQMLTYCSCLTMAHMDLMECLIKEGKYRHGVKRRVTLLGRDADAVYKECCRVFFGEDNPLCDEFGRRSGRLFKDISDAVSGWSGSEKWYQIICALSELVEKLNRKLERTYYFRQASYLYGADRRLSELRYVRNEVVETIIWNIKK